MDTHHPPIRTCNFEDCHEQHYAKGWCKSHYQQQARGERVRKTRSEYSGEIGTCVADNCSNTFLLRTIGSPKLYCSSKCRSRVGAKAKRASGWIPAHKREGRAACKIDGCEKPMFSWEMCIMHYNRAKVSNGDAGEAQPRRASRGAAEWRINREGYMRRSCNGEIQLQHREVMEEHLGRRLWPDETVHHKNGDRSDNRLSNLELWSKWQPAGQRVEDKLAYAREIIARYGDIV